MRKKAQYNIDVAKIFMTRGAEYFYLGYYVHGKQFIRDTYIDKGKIEKMIDTTTNAEDDYKKGSISKNEMIEKTIKNIVLKNIIDFEYEEKPPISLKIYQYIADCIVGNIYSMFKMVADAKEFKKVQKETIQEAENTIYKNIEELFYHTNIGDKLRKTIN